MGASSPLMEDLIRNENITSMNMDMNRDPSTLPLLLT